MTAHRVELFILMKYFTVGVVSTCKMTFDIIFVIVVLNILLALVIMTCTIIRQRLCQEINKINYFDNKGIFKAIFCLFVFASIFERVGNYHPD